ncbi:MAG: prenyltransferase/squalene oxidase repeat-containing protein [Verrucomicrobiales bacterium]
MTPRPFIIFALLLAFLGTLGAQSLPRRQDDPISPEVENMYLKGLKYLAGSQQEDGSWHDAVGREPGVVGLAVLAFLAHGEDPRHGPYATHIKRGLDYILSQQKKTNGYIGNSMYNHGFATLALAECYGILNDPRLATALRDAVDLILSAQKRNPLGGWRYSPDSSDADSTVTGCQIVALYAARNAGLPVPDSAFEKGLKYLARCRNSSGGYGYTSPSGEKPTLTAIGSLCLSLAKKKEGKGYASSTRYLRKHLDYRDKYYPYYFEYYMSQALFHADEELWQDWNEKNIRYLSVLQQNNGSFPGNKGPCFSTTGALLSLALNYRFLPIYEK